MTTHPITKIVGNEKRFCNWGAPEGRPILTKVGKPVGPKAPIYPDRDFAMAWRKPAKWQTLAQAQAGVERNGRQGVGIFTSNGDCPDLTPITCIDLDSCVANGVVTGTWQRELVALCTTLTVISPSGTGLHLWFTGVSEFTAPEIASQRDGVKRGYEVYSKAHHIRLGKVMLHDAPVQPLTAELWQRITALLPGWADEQQAEQAVIEPKPLSDKQIAFVANKFNAANDIGKILQSHGYTVEAERSGKRDVTRAGKDAREGSSGNIKDGIYNPFSANDPLPANKPYTAFGAWCALEHGSNEQQAARAAAQELGIELGRTQQQRNDSSHTKNESDDLLPRIQTNGREMRDTSADAIKALAATGEIFIRSGELVRVRVDEKGRAGIEAVGESAMRGMLARAANFFRVTIRDDNSIETVISPPLDIVRDVLSLGEWPFKPLEGVIESPTMRPDGSILRDAGYDSATRLFYQPAPDFVFPNIPDRPTREDVDAALTLLHDVVVDFPFEDEASRDNALAAMLTPVARPMIAQAVPLAIADAPQQGTGKTLLAQVIGELATGEIPEPSPAPDAAEEWRKTVTAQLSAGRAVIVLDNVTKTLEDGSLAAVLTSTTWSDRLMGRNDRLIRLPARACWMVTGNNVRVGGDLVSRCYLIRLDAKTSRPQERDSFKHPQIETWVKDNRGVLLGAALTLCRAWHVAGRPAPTCPKSRYAEWRTVIGGILEYAGAKSFLGNLRHFQDTADTEGPAWEAFILKMAEVFNGQAATPAQIYARLAASDELAQCLPDDLTGLLGEPEDQKAKNKFAQRLGYAFRERIGKRYGDSQARIELDRATNRAQFWIFMS